jgi:type 1 glutamine amidotransferase
MNPEEEKQKQKIADAQRKAIVAKPAPPRISNERERHKTEIEPKSSVVREKEFSEIEQRPMMMAVEWLRAAGLGRVCVRLTSLVLML